MAQRYLELDSVDRMMIALLQKDGRMTTQALAQSVGVSEVTARRKLRRLLSDGVVQIVAAVDPFQIGYESPVIIGLKIDRRRIDEIAQRLCEHPSIRYVGASTGHFDLIIEVVAASNHDLAEFVLGYLSEIPGIQATDTEAVHERLGNGQRAPAHPAATPRAGRAATRGTRSGAPPPAG